MNRRIWMLTAMALIVTLLAGLPLSGAALAQGGNPGGPLNRLGQNPAALGQVTQVSNDQFTLQTAKGDEVTFRYDQNTRFVDTERQPRTSADLKQGGWVTVMGGRRDGVLNLLQRLLDRRRGAGAAQPAAEDNQPTLARIVVLMPADFDPANLDGLRGQVTAVDAARSQFSLQDLDGATSLIRVDQDTRFAGQAHSLAALEVGMSATVRVEKQADGSLLALAVRAGNQPLRLAGQAVSVDTGSGQLVIKTLRGQEVTVQVDDSTVFRSRDNSLHSLADVQPGMKLLVAARPQSNGKLLAVSIAAGGMKK